MLIAALFTIAKTWKQLNRPSPDEWIKTIQYIYAMKLLIHKKNEIMPFAATWNGPRDYPKSKVSQTEKDKYMISFIGGIPKKNSKINLFTKQK